MLLVTGAMAWSTATTERAAWDVFVWYGGLLRMGEILNATGATKFFAESVGALFAGIPWLLVLLAILVIYFYTHYAFASITAHVLAMFPPFVVLLVSIGVPPQLAVYSLLCLANLPAGLTHYGTTTGPILFGVGLRVVQRTGGASGSSSRWPTWPSGSPSVSPGGSGWGSGESLAMSDWGLKIARLLSDVGG